MANRSVQLFRQVLAAAPPVIRRTVLEALGAGARDIADVMRLTVPRKSGRLAGSIRVEAGRRPGVAVIKAGGAATSKPVRKGGPPYDYSMAIEFGTRPHTLGGFFSGARHPGTRPRPFFWPAYRLRKRPVKAAITRKTKAAILSTLGAR